MKILRASRQVGDTMRLEGPVAVLGAGTMGSDIALLFALAGFDVIVREISDEALAFLRRKNEDTLNQLVRAGKVREEPKKIIGRIRATRELDYVKEAGFVFEAISENLEAKKKLFEELEKIVSKEAVLVTNTSSYRVTEIFEQLAKPERAGGMHFSNPPIEMPLVEVVKGEKTSEETLASISKMAEKIGKTPVLIKKDVRGFILNRILFVSMADGLWAIQRGEVKPEELDAAIHSIGIPTGIAEGVDIIGVDIVSTVSKNLVETYGERFELPPMLKRMLEEKKLGKKSGRGFYDWRKGRPKIDPNLAGKFDTSRTVAVAVNEATRLIKERVADPETIDKVVELGLMMPAGPCKMGDAIGLGYVLETLEDCHKKYGKELYSPSPLLRECVSTGKKFYE